MNFPAQDTTAEVEARIIERYRSMTPNQRFQEMLDLNAFVTQTQMTAIRAAYPEADEFEIKMRVASRWVRNPELLKAAFGWDVAEKGLLMVNDAIDAIRKFVAALEELEIDYFIGGSMASIVYGKARTTRDVDFVLTVRAEDAQRLVTRLEADFQIDIVAVERSISTGDCFNALDLETVFQADVFTPHSSDWIEEQFAQRQPHRLGAGEDTVEVYLCSPEHVVLSKLEWFRLGNEVSRLQWEDAIGVLLVQKGRLDDAYLHVWARRLGLSDLLSKALLAVT